MPATLRRFAAAFACLALLGTAARATAAECVVPAKPGGGMDLTCKLAKKALAALPEQPRDPPQDASRNQADGKPLQLRYLPGGIGAAAWSTLVTQRRDEPDTLVAFSGGSLLNLAQGKFGPSKVDDVRWVAAIGTDYGMIAVRRDSPYRTLHDLVEALKRDPASVTIGAGGTIGSQDWVKVALIVKQDGIDPKSLRFVALEGGGESFTALLAGHVQAVSGDASEAMLHAADGSIRVLAVLSDARLPGMLASVPTAREQGYDVTWPTIRGFYMGPQVSDADYRKWVGKFDRLLGTPEFERLRAAAGLFPFAMTGKTLTEYIDRTVARYGVQAKEMELMR